MTDNIPSSFLNDGEERAKSLILRSNGELVTYECGSGFDPLLRWGLDSIPLPKALGLLHTWGSRQGGIGTLAKNREHVDRVVRSTRSDFSCGYQYDPTLSPLFQKFDQGDVLFLNAVPGVLNKVGQGSQMGPVSDSIYLDAIQLWWLWIAKIFRLEMIYVFGENLRKDGQFGPGHKAVISLNQYLDVWCTVSLNRDPLVIEARDILRDTVVRSLSHPYAWKFEKMTSRI